MSKQQELFPFIPTPSRTPAGKTEEVPPVETAVAASEASPEPSVPPPTEPETHLPDIPPFLDVDAAPIVLTGLDGSNPLGFLAALGVLVVLDAHQGDAPAPRLSWRNEGLWHPVLHGVVSADALLDVLDVDRQHWSQEPALTLEYKKKSKKTIKTVNDIKPPPGGWRTFVTGLLMGSHGRSLKLAAGLATETVFDQNGFTKPTAMHFTAGNQQFLSMVAQLQEHTTREHFDEALWGPWTYNSELPLMGWDSTSNRDYALRSSDPSKDPRTGVPGADWLALLALSVFPVGPMQGQVRTTGCTGGWKNGAFHWPLWSCPATLNPIASLLQTNSWDQKHWTIEQLRTRGIETVLQSQILRTDKGGYGSINPARVLLCSSEVA